MMLANYRLFLVGIAGLSALGCLLAFGCQGSGPAAYPVTGSVTFDEEPVADGEIVFLSVDNSAAPAAGKITAGSFSATVPPGPKKVEIRAARMEPLPAGQTGAMGETETMVDYIPARYNAKTELTAEVEAGGKNQFTFALTSDKKK